MDISYLFKGIVLGLSIAAPVGPIGVLCIRRTLVYGRMIGLASGLGAATADAFYGSIAGFGLTAVSGLLVSQQLWLRIIGGAFLCYLGARTFLASTSDTAAMVRGDGLLGAFGSTLFLTLTNPLTILSFVAVFAGLGLGSGASFATAVLLVVGVFTGSALWWLILSSSVSFFRGRFSLRGMRWVNRLSGILITAFGLAALSSLLAQ